jgi:hypothetical protein
MQLRELGPTQWELCCNCLIAMQLQLTAIGNLLGGVHILRNAVGGGGVVSPNVTIFYWEGGGGHDCDVTTNLFSQLMKNMWKDF